jgi:uncharacterized protein YndB with AHSA1/START domain
MTEGFVIERKYPASVERLWQLWTTAEGIESWWGPDGFEVRVDELDLRPGGVLRYTQRAVGDSQIAFLKDAGMPLDTEARVTFREVRPGRRLSFTTLVDFVPDVRPYEVNTTVDLIPGGDGDARRDDASNADASSTVRVTAGAMHDEQWAALSQAGQENELDNLADVIDAERARDVEPPPYSYSPLSGIYAGQIPFGAPPDEPVTLEGDIPWELRES